MICSRHKTCICQKLYFALEICLTDFWQTCQVLIVGAIIRADCCWQPSVWVAFLLGMHVMRVLIFANGDVAEVGWIRPYLQTRLSPPPLIIAANGGTRHLWALGVCPHLLIGDADSLPPALMEWLVQGGTQIMRAPVEKDETDLELALLHAAAQNAGEIWVFGAFGGRIDQTLGNIFLLAHPALMGRRVTFFSEHQRLWLIGAEDGVVPVNGRIGDTLSLIPCGVDVRVRATTGLAWPLQDAVLTFGPARGLSNRLTAAVATIEVANGRLICVHTQQSWQR